MYPLVSTLIQAQQQQQQQQQLAPLSPIYFLIDF